MYLCYIEESGESGTFNVNDPNSNPFFIIIGLFVEASQVLSLTQSFLRSKLRFFPSLRPDASVPFLDCIEFERKGGEIRKALRSGNQRRWQQSIGFLDDCIDILQTHQAKLLGKIVIKDPGQQNSDAAIYGGSVMHICQHFNTFLCGTNSRGLVLADSRKVAQNRRTTHTIFTQMYKRNGNSYPRIVEPPVYGHSNNFAMLQLADIVCSSIIFPMAINAFGSHLAETGNIHFSPAFALVRQRYQESIMKLQYRHREANGKQFGGLLAVDLTGLGRKTSLLFRSCED